MARARIGKACGGMIRFAIIDCGIGNLRSVQKIFERLDATTIITDDAAEVTTSDAIVLPGVGAFGDAMKKLEADGTADAIRLEAGERGKPLLGICLGMQLLGQTSAESPGIDGLGLVPGETVPLDVTGKTDWINRKLTLPHVGWNTVTQANKPRLFDELEPDTDFYFVHSFRMTFDDQSWVSGTADYGEEFVCSIEKNSIYATQFHPEKSQKQGQALISNFIGLAKRAVAA